MKLNVRVKNGNLDLTASGVFLVDTSQLVTLTIQDNEEPMHIKMTFVDDVETDKTVRNVKQFEEENTIELEFVNYNSVYGYYTTEPWLIGSSFGRQMFLSYCISDLIDSHMKKIEYSFFLGKEVNNG